MTFISRYIESVKFYRLAEKKLGNFRLNIKGKAISFIIRQILLFFIDGTHKAISGFDHLKKDDGYASIIEVKKETLLSSHSIKRFGMNAAYYYLMVIAHTLYESYKEDVVNEAGIKHIKARCYPTTFRRVLIDFAVQIVSGGNSISLSVMACVRENLKLDALWELSRGKNLEPIPIL